MMAAALLLALGAPVPPDAAAPIHIRDAGRASAASRASITLGAAVRLVPPATLRGGSVEAGAPFQRRATTIDAAPGERRAAVLIEFE